jgi:hypothetical protein
LSETVTRDAKTPYEKAIAIRQYLARMRYVTEVKASPRGADGVDYFLFEGQAGNCVYFASAMAVMLRSVGVPTRLCIGYLPGEYQSSSSSYTVGAQDYHAWTQIYLPPYGWIDFEATPSVESVLENGRGNGGQAPTDLAEEDDTYISPNASSSGGATNIRQPLPPAARNTIFGILSLALLVFCIRMAYRYWLRRLVGNNYASEVYAKMCFLASAARLRPKPQQTPLEYAIVLVSQFPLQSEALHNITQVYLENRYSPRKELVIGRKMELEMSWQKVYPVLLRRLFRLKR